MIRSFRSLRCIKASLQCAFQKKSYSKCSTRFAATQVSHKGRTLSKHYIHRLAPTSPSKYTQACLLTMSPLRYYSLPSYTKINLPALSPTMEMGTISSWVVKEGDKFDPGDLLAEIETDKATVGFEAQDEGYIAKILIEEGTKDVALGTPIAISVENEEDVAAFKDFSLDGASTDSNAVQLDPSETKPAVVLASSYPRHDRITLPALSPTMTAGTLSKWAVKEGDKVEEGDLLADIETDKATMAMEAENEGYIAKIVVAEGSKDVPLGTLLCIQVENEADIAAFSNFINEGTDSSAPQSYASQPASPLKHQPPVSFRTAPMKSDGRVFVSPLARKIAVDYDVNLSQVQGTGPNGRIRQRDVLLYVEQARKAETVPENTHSTATTHDKTVPFLSASHGDFIDIPLSNIRKVTAKRLTESKQNLPHYYLSIDCNMDNLLKWRMEFNSNDNVKLSVNDFLIKAAALACLKVPEVNSSWQNTHIRQFNNVDVSVAVSTNAGLITPIVFNAHTKRLEAISKDITSLAQKAREGKLQPNEFMGGTFTISNLGMFGIKNFTAVINPPQACILAVGESRQEFIPSESQERGFSLATLMTVTLSCDHRVVDGAVGAQWLKHFKKFVEHPSKMLL